MKDKTASFRLIAKIFTIVTIVVNFLNVPTILLGVFTLKYISRIDKRVKARTIIDLIVAYLLNPIVGVFLSFDAIEHKEKDKDFTYPLRLIARFYLLNLIISSIIMMPILGGTLIYVQYVGFAQVVQILVSATLILTLVTLVFVIAYGFGTLKYLNNIEEGIAPRTIDNAILAFIFNGYVVGLMLLVDYLSIREHVKKSTNEKERVLINEPNADSVKTTLRKVISSAIYYISGSVISFFFILPLLYMIAASTKDDQTIAFDNNSILMFIPNVTNILHIFDNYVDIITKFDIWKYALNSFIYAAVVIVFNVLVNGLAGYALAKFHFPAKGFFSFIILFLIVVPVETSIIPLYSIVKQILGLKGSLSVLGVILPSIISVFNIFLFTQFFSSIPKEYEEAMRIDGSSRVRIFFDLILPLSKPIVTTTVVFTFIGVWNDYVWPSMVLPNTGDGSWPLLPIQAALTSIQSIDGISTGQIMASLVITSLPIFILYALAQKYIVKGFGTAGLKM